MAAGRATHVIGRDGQHLVHRLAGFEHDQRGHQFRDRSDRHRDMLVTGREDRRIGFVEDVERMGAHVGLRLRLHGTLRGGAGRSVAEHGRQEDCHRHHCN